MLAGCTFDGLFFFVIFFFYLANLSFGVILRIIVVESSNFYAH